MAIRGRGVTANLATISDGYARAFMAGYAEGYQHGVVRALDDVDAADDLAWAQLSQRVRKQSNSARFSQLATRRGDHERAQRARDWERANGLGTVA